MQGEKKGGKEDKEGKEPEILKEDGYEGGN